MQVKLDQMDDQLKELVERVRRGEEVTITGEDERPLVKLVNAQERPLAQRPFGSARGKVRMAEDFDEPLEDFAEYME